MHFYEVSLTYITATFEIMASYFCISLYRVISVSFEIFALLSGTYLCISKLLGINIEVSGIGHKLLWFLHEVDV